MDRSGGTKRHNVRTMWRRYSFSVWGFSLKYTIITAIGWHLRATPNLSGKFENRRVVQQAVMATCFLPAAYL